MIILTDQAINSPFGPQIGFGWCSAQSPKPKLHPLEAACLGPRAGDQRRLDFALGRGAARQALAQVLGADPPPVGMDDHGRPDWPPGLTGSIAHSAGLGLAIAARIEIAAGLGLDLEAKNRPISTGLVHKIAHPSERDRIESDPSLARFRLLSLFSAKEAVYKAFSPLIKQPPGFLDAELTWSEAEQTYHGRWLVSLGPGFEAGYPFKVGLDLTRDYLLTSVRLDPARPI